MSILGDNFSWYNVVEIGSDSIEALVSSKDKQLVMKNLKTLESRVRINNYGNTQIYAWQSRNKTTLEFLKNHPEYIIAIRLTSHKGYL